MMHSTHSHEKKLRVGVVTGSRAEFGLLRPVYTALAAREDCKPLLYVTGMHLLPEFGSSVEAIDLPIAARVPMYTDTLTPIAIGASGLGTAFAQDSLDYLIVLGDRKETLAAALAAFDLGIPVAHIHGGDRAESGHQDEIMRPVISLLSTLHFTASKKSKERLVRLGIDESHITISGSPAIDAVKAHTFPSRDQAHEMLGVKNSYAVLAFHPHDRAAAQGGQHMRTILEALRRDSTREIVIIYPNNDTGHEQIIEEIEKEREQPGVHILKNMPQPQFLDALRYADFLIGNSSAAMYECSFMEVAAINVGNRNRGREHGPNVLDAEPEREALVQAIAQTKTDAFKNSLTEGRTHFGDGSAASIIAREVCAFGSQA